MSVRSQGARGLTLYGASAGSGKTHKLTEVVAESVAPGHAEAVDPEALVAVTYTRRAAAELAARIRRTLIEEGATDRALRLPLAYLGTVHSVCLRLVQEFALDAGLSPQVAVLPGDEARWLREALERGLDPTFRARLDTLAAHLELNWNPQTRRHNFLDPVQDIMTLARSNRISASALPGMGERAAKRLLALLGKPQGDGEALDRALIAVLEKVTRDLRKADDDTKQTKRAVELAEDVLRRARSHQLHWSDWIRLQRLQPAKDSMPIVAPVVAAASAVDTHPRLHEELWEMTVGIYEAARQGLEAYDAWKKRRRVVDFVDMIDRALTLLDRMEVQEELRARLRLLVVDEFQDTSPVQLALFVRLQQIAGRSVWVGDRKQCIFEFAGADPMLMEAVSQWARTSGGDTPQLEFNWRSRPELVAACSRLFAAAFEPHGYTAADVVVKSKRATPKRLASLPPLGLWWLDAGNQADAAGAMAEGVRRLLEDPAATSVVDRAADAPRDLRASDIAILVATNKEAQELALQLAARGVRATVARAGLLSTPEGTLVQSGLSVLIDRRDALSSATLDALTGFGKEDPEAWLDRRIAAEAARVAARERGEEPTPENAPDPVVRLESLRERVEAMAPSEALDAVLATLDVASLCARWPDPEQRLANLDALRALTAKYEDSCAHRREGATVAGLLRYFDQAAEERFVRDEEIAVDDQHVGAGERAITITTYHRAKGLEWPVVILTSLDRGPRRDAFEVCPESDRDAFDAADPLGGRWIRYWPWPFGPQQKTRLADQAAASAEGLAVSSREERERVRLLYVGFTRARDHLILAACVNRSGHAKWLDELVDKRGNLLLELPAAVDPSGKSVVRIGSGTRRLEVPARHWQLGTDASPPARLAGAESHVWFEAPAALSSPRPRYGISPSSAAVDWPDLPPLALGAAESIGKRLPLGKRVDVESDVIGNAVHAFLAADVPERTREERMALAERLLTAAELGELLSPGALLQSSDQLRAWVDRRWPGAVWRREYPVRATVDSPMGARRVHGTIDLLLETPDGVVIVDHKSYLGEASRWPKKAGEFASQLAAYVWVMRAAGKRVLGSYVHFAVGAGTVELVDS